MKKRLIAGFLLLVLAVGGLGAAHARLTKSFHQPELTETVLWGDPAKAEGLTMKLHTVMDRHLYWDTTLRPGQKPEYEAWYKAKRDYPVGEPRYELWMQTAHNFSGGFFDARTDPFLRSVRKLLLEMLEDMEPGEQRTETIRYRDYYDYFPLDVSVDFPGYRADWDHLRYMDEGDKFAESQLKFLEDMDRTFRFPVPEDYQLELTVLRDKRDEYGVSVECNVVEGGLGFDCRTAAADSTVYFMPLVMEPGGETLADYSHTPGYGIYALPNKAGQKDQRLTIDELQLVYPLPEDQILLGMELDYEKENLLLITDEKGAKTLRVVDLDTMTEKQAVSLPENESEYLYLTVEEDFLVCQGKAMHVYSLDEDGRYHYELTAKYPADLPELEGKLNVEYWGYDTFDFDGEQLARAIYASRTEPWYMEDCGAYLMTYDRDGLTCAIRYDSSLSRSGNMGSNMDCRSDDYNPMTVSWN